MIDIRPVDGLSEDPEQQRLMAGLAHAHGLASRELFGDEHSGWTVEELRGKRAQDGWDFIDAVAVDGGGVVGMSAMALPLADNPQLAMLMLAVVPAHRRQGVGTALLERAMAQARVRGRTVLQADTEWLADGEDESGAQFAAPAGFAATQTMVRSAMQLPANRQRLQADSDGDGVEDAAAFALEAVWALPPAEWLDDLAVLKQRMSTDAPLGETSLEEEQWDAARVERGYAWAEEAGRLFLTVVARERATGRLVGITEVQVTPQDPTLAYQQDTLVLREARGHRLGLRLKAAAALELMQAQPQVTRVRTWNADDNRHMLAVNTDLGYEPEGYLRIWERRLD